MSLQSFMDGMSKAGEKITGGSPGSIMQVKVEFGCHKFIEGQDFWASWVPSAQESDIPAANEACYKILRKHKSTESPEFGLHIHMYGDTALPNAWKGDSREFVGNWRKDAYELLKNRMAQVDGLKVNKVIWARVKNIPDPYFVARGEVGKTVLREKDGIAVKDGDGKNIYDYKTIKIVTEVFANKAAAQKAAEGGTQVANSSGLSAKAQKNNVTLELLQEYAEQIHANLSDGMEAQVVANKFGVEPDDLKLANIELAF